MKNSMVIICIFLLSAFSYSCSRQCRQFREYGDLVQCNCRDIHSRDSISARIKSHQDSITPYKAHYGYCPILINKKTRVGIYQYWTGGDHTPKNNFFAYDGYALIYLKSDDMEDIKSFLKKNNFNDKEIEKHC